MSEVKMTNHTVKLIEIDEKITSPIVIKKYQSPPRYSSTPWTRLLEVLKAIVS